jgi:hypothetical protein
LGKISGVDEDCAQDDASTAQQTFEYIVSRVHKLDEQTKKLDASIGVGAGVRVDALLARNGGRPQEREAIQLPMRPKAGPWRRRQLPPPGTPRP